MIKNFSKRIYTSTDFAKQSENEHFRYLNNAPKVGHAFIKKATDGTKIAYQYSYEVDEKHLKDGELPGHVPVLKPLTVITEVNRYGLERHEAQSPGGTEYAARRYLDVIDENGDLGKIAFFSPKGKDKNIFWGSEEATPLFREDLAHDDLKDLQREIDELSGLTKGGKVTTLNHEHIKVRDASSRGKTQNAVMDNVSAQAYVQSVLDERREELHPDIVARLERWTNAELLGKRATKKQHYIESHYRPEWLHALGYSLTPLDQNPQTKENLGAASKWCNTEMMLIERVAKWYKLNEPESEVKIKPEFEMFLDTEMIHKVALDADIEHNEKRLYLFSDIDPFKKYPMLRKASDVAQSTMVVHGYLNQRTPAIINEVKKENSFDSNGTSSRKKFKYK